MHDWHVLPVLPFSCISFFSYSLSYFLSPRDEYHLLPVLHGSSHFSAPSTPHPRGRRSSPALPRSRCPARSRPPGAGGLGRALGAMAALRAGRLRPSHRLPPGPDRAEPAGVEPSWEGRAEGSGAELSGGIMLGMVKNSLLSTVEAWPYRLLSKGEKVCAGGGPRCSPGGSALRRCEGKRVSPPGSAFLLAAPPPPSRSPGSGQLRGEGVRGREVRGRGAGGQAVRRSLEGRGSQATQVRRRKQRQGWEMLPAPRGLADVCGWSTVKAGWMEAMALQTRLACGSWHWGPWMGMAPHWEK